MQYFAVLGDIHAWLPFKTIIQNIYALQSGECLGLQSIVHYRYLYNYLRLRSRAHFYTHRLKEMNSHDSIWIIISTVTSSSQNGQCIICGDVYILSRTFHPGWNFLILLGLIPNRLGLQRLPPRFKNLSK